MAYSAVSVANSIIKLVNERGVRDLSPMKLQKLMYFTQFWYFKNYDEFLINDNFSRWKFGPVIPSIYYELKNYGSMHVDSYIRQLSSNNEAVIYMIANDDSRAWSLLSKIFDASGNIDGIELSALTHRQNSSWSLGELDTVITAKDMRQSEI